MFAQTKTQQNQEPGFGIEPKAANRINPRMMVTVYFINLMSLDRKPKEGEKAVRPVQVFVPTLGRVITMPPVGESIDIPSVAIPELKMRTRWKDSAGISHDGITDSPLIASAIKDAVARGQRSINMQKAMAQANLQHVDPDVMIEALLARGGETGDMPMPETTRSALEQLLRQARTGRAEEKIDGELSDEDAPIETP